MSMGSERKLETSQKFFGFPRNPAVVCLGNALKGTLSVKMAQRSLELGSRLAGASRLMTYCLSDGGDGFLDAYEAVYPGQRQRIVVPGPTGDLTFVELLLDSQSSTVVIESALSVGMSQLPADPKGILQRGTGGLGDTMLAGVLMGARRILVGLGGSATCDGGLGLLFHLQEGLKAGTKINTHIGADSLANPPALDFDFLRTRLNRVEIDVFCDVDNPLLGENGTVAKYAEQKGATEHDRNDLSALMEHWADHLEKIAGPGHRDKPGAGAAGGLGFALSAIGADLLPGADSFCDLLRLDDILSNANALITCEGRFDSTSLNGKAPWKAAIAARDRGLASAIFCGSAEEPAVKKATDEGIRIVEFGKKIPPERRVAESFTALQSSVSEFIRSVGGR